MRCRVCGLLRRQNCVIRIDLGAHRVAQVDDPGINDPVVNLNAVASLAQNTRLEQGAEVLRHVGLGRFNFRKQFADIFF